MRNPRIFHYFPNLLHIRKEGVPMLNGIMQAIPGATAQGLIWGIMALGVYITYKILDLPDLTVDQSLCTGGGVTAILIINGMHPFPAIFLAMIAGMAAGLVTGILHAKLNIPAILSGILTQLALYSINMRIMGKSNLALLNQPTMLTLGNVNQALMIAGIFVFAIITLTYWFFGTEIGSALRATGDNENMVRALGVSTNFMKILGLVLSNGLVALSGALLAQFQGYADINMGRGAIVIGLASVIIGDVMFGAKFNFAFKLCSIVFGSIIYFFIIATALQLGLQSTDLKLISSILVVLALVLSQVKFKKTKPSTPQEVS